MRNTIMALLLATTTLSATAQTYTNKEFKPLHRLAGTWKMESNRGALYEEWQLTNDNKLSGRSYKLNNSDTVILERTTLYLDAGKIIYSPEVTNQNNAQPVPFQLISVDKQYYTFENKEHDFPQRIIYRLVSFNVVHARIEGTKDGKKMGSDFNYTKVK